MRVQWEDEPNYDTIEGGERNNMIDIAMKNSSCDREERKLFKEPTDRENVKSIFGCKSKESIFLVRLGKNLLTKISLLS